MDFMLSNVLDTYAVSLKLVFVCLLFEYIHFDSTN